MNVWLTKSKIRSRFVSNADGVARYPFVASVELVDLESALQLQERVTDLSLYGCRVTASKPLPVGIKLRVRITSKGSTFSAPGKVAYATSNGEYGNRFCADRAKRPNDFGKVD